MIPKALHPRRRRKVEEVFQREGGRGFPKRGWKRFSKERVEEVFHKGGWKRFSTERVEEVLPGHGE